MYTPSSISSRQDVRTGAGYALPVNVLAVSQKRSMMLVKSELLRDVATVIIPTVLLLLRSSMSKYSHNWSPPR